jgi:two-component system phosphate regulon response regulator PhoB
MIATLVIGGSELACRTLATHLPLEGFEPQFVASGAEGVMRAKNSSFAVLLLDWQLPDMAGSEVCRQLKLSALTRDLPLIVVTALDAEIDRIVAFELGALDYVIEPFSVRELTLRLRVALEGKSPIRPVERRARGHELLTLDFQARCALVQGREIALSPREFAVLSALRRQPGLVISRLQLRKTVWGAEAVSLRTVDASMKRLRRKLGSARHTIETVRGVGYRFRALEASPTTALPTKIANGSI